MSPFSFQQRVEKRVRLPLPGAMQVHLSNPPPPRFFSSENREPSSQFVIFRNRRGEETSEPSFSSFLSWQEKGNSPLPPPPPEAERGRRTPFFLVFISFPARLEEVELRPHFPSRLHGLSRMPVLRKA